MYRTQIWTQWDQQEERRQRFVRQTAAWRDLNNLYLQIERGAMPLTIHTANQLRTLAGQAYDRDDPMRDWWLSEFQQLPGWEEV